MAKVIINFAILVFAVLYAFFGLRLLYIAWRSDSKGSQKKEMEEVRPILDLSCKFFYIFSI